MTGRMRLFGRGELYVRRFAKRRKKIEGDLRVVLVLRKRLKAEEVDGLLVQLVHGFAPVLGGGLDHGCGERPDREPSLNAGGDSGQHDGGGMGRDHGGRVKV